MTKEGDNCPSLSLIRARQISYSSATQSNAVHAACSSHHAHAFVSDRSKRVRKIPGWQARLP